MKKLVSISLLLVLAAACARAPLTKSKYAGDGLSFTYLSDWNVKSDKIVHEATGVRIVTLEGPEGTVLTITRFPLAAQLTLEEYATKIEEKRGAAVEKATRGILRADDKQTVRGAAQTKIAGQPREGLSQVFQMAVLGISTSFRADFYMIEDESFKWVLMAQQPVDSQKKIDPEIQLIYDSLSMGAARPQEAGQQVEKK